MDSFPGKSGEGREHPFQQALQKGMVNSGEKHASFSMLKKGEWSSQTNLGRRSVVALGSAWRL